MLMLMLILMIASKGVVEGLGMLGVAEWLLMNRSERGFMLHVVDNYKHKI